MPNAATTEASSACETTGTPVPLAYGYVWATGKRHAYFMLQETGQDSVDFTRIGYWLLGHGEWDGCSELWINDQLAWVANVSALVSTGAWTAWAKALDYSKQPLIFNFHSGCDSVIGSGLTPASYGPDQGCDALWTVFPPAIQPLCFSRIAYYSLMRKQPILYQQNTNQNDPSQWTDIAPIGLWRALKCRLFDADGNVTGYAFTRNPVWHWVDIKLRRELFPDYNIPFGANPDALPAAVSARFNWSKIYASAQYCNQQLANGQPRFTGDYAFSQQTSLQAITAKMLRACRGFEQESQGQMAVVVDQPRPSVFTVSREHILPGSWSATDAPLSTAGNRILGSFRDVLVPACSTIASITNTLQADPEVTTDEPHPFIQGDRIAMGGTGTVYDSTWEVSSVPDIIDPGTPSEVDPTTFTIARKGDNYPAAVGAGGACGLLYSRFKERTPEFWHKNNMLARGAFALNLARQRNKVKDALDFDSSTYDQVSRICRYERDRNLGFDEAPYEAPARVKFKMSMFAKDGAGNLAVGIETGDRITLDDTARWPYAGDYEVMDGLGKSPPQCSTDASGSTLGLTPDPNSGEITLALRTYDEGYMYDTSDDIAAGWPSVPGSYPGNDAAFSSVPLANGGNFVFFAGQQPTGTQFQLPSIGYPPTNTMVWAGPAGTNIAFHSATAVQLCDADSNRVLTLIYVDGDGNSWGGDVNFACLTWLSPDVTNTDGHGMTWLPLTLLGGEEILFGSGVLADGATLTLPSGWDPTKCFATAFLHDTENPGSSHILYLCGAWVDGSMGVHCQLQDHSGFAWQGNARIMVFAWKNNMGTVVSEATATGNWVKFPLTDGSVFGMGCMKNVADSTTITAPASLGTLPNTLEPILGPSDDFYTSGGGHAQGVGSCFLDQNDEVHCTFNDGSGDVWVSVADIMAGYTIAATAVPILVLVTPPSISVPQGSIASFSALVKGSSNQGVTWKVDGVAGGNATVGTIDVDGNYTAPTAPGSHAITAISVVDGTAVGAAAVIVTGATSVQIRIGMTSLDAVAEGGASLTLQQPPAGVALAAASGAMSYTVGNTVPVTLMNPTEALYYTRGIKRVYGPDFTIAGTTLTIVNAKIAPQTGDTHELYGT